jgi:hypothetical protein
VASLAVSPDGSQLALTALADPGENTSRGYADAITVVNLRTGARHTWRDGLYRPGRLFTIPDLSWTADGRSLIFLGLWCAPPLAALHCTDTSGQEHHDVQVRSLSPTAGGGTLGRSALLVSQSARYPLIVDAAAGPGPSQLTLLVLSGHPRAGVWPVVSMDRVSAATGALLGVTYRTSTDGTGAGTPTGGHISADPGGRNLLFSYYGRNGLYSGWVSQGKLSLLPVRQPYLPAAITAW